MREIYICKAEGVGEEEVEEATIRISGCMPSFSNHPCWRAKAEKVRDDQAHALCDILFDTLPGGVLDALTAEMLRRKAGVLRRLLK